MSDIKIEWDEAKRAKTLAARKLDFADALHVFQSPHFQLADDRDDYGEARLRVFGWLDGRRVVIVWTPRGDVRRIISMRHGHKEEFESLERALGRS